MLVYFNRIPYDLKPPRLTYKHLQVGIQVEHLIRRVKSSGILLQTKYDLVKICHKK